MGNELKKLRRQLDYIEEIDYILLNIDDGGLYHDFTDKEEETYLNFLDFISNLKILKEKQLNKIEKSNL